MTDELKKARELVRKAIIAYNKDVDPRTLDFFLCVRDDDIALVFYDDATNEFEELGRFEVNWW